MERRLLTLAFCILAGCWTEEPLIHDAFTPDQWAHLQQEFAPHPDELPTCDDDCKQLATFGQQLFFEPRLSGPWVKVLDPNDPSKPYLYKYPAAKTPCTSCHDAGKPAIPPTMPGMPGTPGKPGWFADIRSDNATSLKADSNKTQHNTISLVNVHVGNRELFTWAGGNCGTADNPQPCKSAIDVVQNIALPGAMKSDPELVALTIRNDAKYRMSYLALFGDQFDNDQTVRDNVEIVLDAYMRQLVSMTSRFDKFIAGDDTALDVREQRGFAVFVGRGLCSECHRGWRFTDDLPHVTGVDDKTPKPDTGYKDGAFLTPSLRHVADTAPYMHSGTVNTLTDVIWFYRNGGEPTTFVKDPLMLKPDIDDDDAGDLEAFLRALTGDPMPDELRVDTQSHGYVACKRYGSSDGAWCGNACVDLQTDPMNCGSCGNVCPSNKPNCITGTCMQ